MDNTTGSPHKILFINIFGIGDVLFTTPLISNVKKKYPDAFIGYVANKRTAPLLLDNPKVDTVYTYERDDFYGVYKQSVFRFLKKLRDFVNEIKKERYDLVIDISLNTSSSYLTWLIGIPKRIGFNYKNRSPMLTKKIPLKGYENQHVVDYYLDLLKEIGIPAQDQNLELCIKDEDTRWAEQWIEHAGVGKDLVVGVVPGGGASWGKDASYKRWAPEKYAKLADKVIEKFSAKIILMGDKSERDLCLKVAKSMQHKPLEAFGDTSLGQFAALLKKCSFVILNDGGPLHVATAVGTRTISLFGPVDDTVYGPYPKANHIVVTKDIACRPCYRRFRRASCEHINCLNQIEIEDILRKAEEVV